MFSEVLEMPWNYPPTVTTRIIPFLVGNPYKPSFVTVTGWGVDQRDAQRPCFLFISNLGS